MAKLTQNVTPIDLYQSQSEAVGAEMLGMRVKGLSGKEFVLVKAGASALVVGNVIQSPAIDTNFDDLAVATAAAAGDTKLVLTNGSTAVTANMLDGGQAEISVNSASGTNLGDEYTIMGHSTADAAGALTVYLDRPVRTALTTSTTKVTLKKSPFNGVIQAPATTLTGVIVGVAVYAIPAGYYGWIQTKGMAAVLSDATSITATNQQVCGGSGTAGCCTLQVAGLPAIGRAFRAAATGKTIPVLLNL